MESLEISIRDGGGLVPADHYPLLVGRIAQVAGLVVHPKVGADDIVLSLRLQQQSEREERPERTPALTHLVKIVSFGIVHLVVEATVILAVFGDVCRLASVDPVEGRVEDGAVAFGATLQKDHSQGLVPDLPVGGFYRVKLLAGEFLAEVGCCLFRADKGETDPHQHLLRLGGIEGEVEANVLARFLLFTGEDLRG